jgi:hypothetical protein
VQVEDKNGHNKLYAYTRAITGIDQFIYTGRQLLTADPIEPYMISPPVLDGLSFLSNDLLQLMVPTTNYHSYDETYYSYTRHNTRPNQYIKDKNPGVYADRNPRLDWKTHRMRAWRYNGQVFMAGNTETRHSVYQLHDLAGVQERYRAGDRLGGVESDLDLGAIGTNHFGLRIFYGSRKNITGSKHDLHILALGFPPAPPVEYPKYTADHLSAECITGNANVLDQNHDGIVDAADYRYLFAPQFY